MAAVNLLTCLVLMHPPARTWPHKPVGPKCSGRIPCPHKPARQFLHVTVRRPRKPKPHLINAVDDIVRPSPAVNGPWSPVTTTNPPVVPTMCWRWVEWTTKIPRNCDGNGCFGRSAPERVPPSRVNIYAVEIGNQHFQTVIFLYIDMIDAFLTLANHQPKGIMIEKTHTVLCVYI